jgi:hypothetical protein
MMPPPITSSRLQSAGNSSAPVESCGFGPHRDDALLEVDASRTVRTRQLQGKRTGEFCLAVNHVHLALLGQYAEPIGQFRHDAILPRAQALEIDLRRRENDAVGGHVRGVLDHLGRVQQRLGGDTPHIQANAPQHGPAFDQRDLKS